MVLSFLRSLYDPEFPMPRDDVKFRDCLADIELFSVSSQIYCLLKQSGKLEQTPPFFRHQLKAAADRSFSQIWFLKWKEREAHLAFEWNGISVIPLKGVRFAERFFGYFSSRLTGDIDLLIRKADMDRAMDCLRAIGYRLNKIIHNHAVFSGTDGVPVVELHWTLDKANWSDMNPETFWLEATPMEAFTHVLELSVTDTFYFICLHGVRHRMDSIKYLLDIAQMLHAFPNLIDYGKLLSRAASDKTVNRLRTALSIVYGVFPHLRGLKPLPFPVRRSAWSYPAIRDARLRAKSFRYYVYRLFFKFFIFDTWKHRWHAQWENKPGFATEMGP